MEMTIEIFPREEENRWKGQVEESIFKSNIIFIFDVFQIKKRYKTNTNDCASCVVDKAFI